MDFHFTKAQNLANGLKGRTVMHSSKTLISRGALSLRHCRLFKKKIILTFWFSPHKPSPLSQTLWEGVLYLALLCFLIHHFSPTYSREFLLFSCFPSRVLLGLNPTYTYNEQMLLGKPTAGDYKLT